MHYRKPALDGRFWRMWAAVAASSLGNGIFAVALPLLALRFTRSPLLVSGVVIAGQAPAVVAALPIGALADRLNRRRMIVTIQVLRFVTLAGFGAAIVLHRDDLALVYVTAFVLGCLTIAFDIVANACIPSMVADEHLVRANAHLLNAELTSENLLGQAVGGAALAVTPSLPFLAEAASFVVSASLLNGAIPDGGPAGRGASVWQDLREGLRWFMGHGMLRLQTSVVASLAFCQGMVVGVLALYAREDLHLSSAGYGLLLAVSGIGTVLGGFAATRLHDRLGSAMTITAAGLAAAAGYPLLAATRSPLVAAGVLLVQEGAVIVGSTAARSLRQRTVPAEVQGRAASATSVIVMGCIPLGALAGGLLAGATRLGVAFVAASVIQILALALTGPRLLARTRGHGLGLSGSRIDLRQEEPAAQTVVEELPASRKAAG